MADVRQWQVWTATAVLSVVAALSLWYGLTRRGEAGLTLPPTPPPARTPALLPGDPGFTLEASTAMRYALAVQENNCAEMLDLLWWVQERLRMVRLEGEHGGEARERDRLCDVLTDRSLSRGQLSAEGVDDQYIFRPGARIRPVYHDSGRDDLDRPVHERVWLEVEFPHMGSALRDQIGRSIHRIVVGVNLTQDGYVLKAEVVGNMDIDRSTIDYRWPGN